METQQLKTSDLQGEIKNIDGELVRLEGLIKEVKGQSELNSGLLK